MEYRLYKLLNGIELSEIERKLNVAYGIWSSAWLASELPVRIQCHRAAEYRGNGTAKRDAWMYTGTDAAQWVAIIFAPSSNIRLGSSLMASGQAGGAPTRSSALLNDLVMLAATDLIRSLCPWASEHAPEKIPEGAGLPSQVGETGSGAVIAELAWEEERMEIVFSPAQVNAMLGGARARPATKATFAKTTDALLNERLKLTVLVGTAQLELGLLQTIAVGDVIKLNTRIDEPLQVVNTDGTRFCNAFLGSSQGRKAIQLIA